MADVFLSYSNTPEVRTLVRRIAVLLQVHGFTVWWDYGLEAGKKFEEQIVSEIDSAMIVVPLWSEASVRSSWVRRETELGRAKLLPVLLQNVSPPQEYESIHCVNLAAWDGSIDSLSFQNLVATVCNRLGRSSQLSADVHEELLELPDRQPLPHVAAAGSTEEEPSDEVVQWHVAALPILNDCARLYTEMKWKQFQEQKSPSDFVNELERLISGLPPLPPSGKRAGLQQLLKKHIEAEIHEGHPIPDSYQIEPVLTELAKRPGIMITCYSNREGFGQLSTGLVVKPAVGNPYAENLKSASHGN